MGDLETGLAMASSEDSNKTPLLTVDLGDIKDSGDELASFLTAKCKAEVQKEGSSLKIYRLGGKGIGGRIVRTYLKKFIHQKGLKNEVRVLLKAKVFSFQPLEEGEEVEEE